MFLAKLLLPRRANPMGAAEPRPVLNRFASPMLWAMLAAVLWIPALVLVYFLWPRPAAASGPQLTYSGPALVFQIQDVGELTTLRYEIQKIVTAQEKAFQILDLPISTEKLTLIVYLTAEFRYDLKAVQPGDISVTGEAPNQIVTLRLPPPTLAVNLNTQQTVVYEHTADFTRRLLNGTDPNFETWLRKTAETETKVALKNGDGPEKARHNAEELLHGLMAPLGVKQVKIETVRRGPADLVRYAVDPEPVIVPAAKP